MTWLDADAFSSIAGVSARHARRIFKASMRGTPWQNAALVVRTIRGRGGKSGLRQEVFAASLPDAYQSALSGDLDPSPHACEIVAHASPDASLIVRDAYAERRRPAPGQGKRIEARWRVIEDALEHPPRSAERAAEIRRASRKWGHSVRTVQRWIEELEASDGDMSALARRKPADAGQPRIAVSRRFDKAFLAAGHDPAFLPELGARVDQLTKAVWASPAQRAGWKRVRREILTLFNMECRERGLALPSSAFDISCRRVMRAEHYRVADIYDHDRKSFDDAKPRIRRDWSKAAPMQTVVMDVKPLDNIVLRPNGSTTWPKMIAFMDAGTHRIFRHFVLLEPGEGVRQEHVIQGFVEMVTHPEWGFPQQLYMDNGSEYAMFDMIRDALELVAEPGTRTIIKARPYSGASKPIESKFAVLDRQVFSQMGGWAGGNRINKKTQTVGKPPKPYAGSFDQFVVEANKRILDFESWPLGSGPFKGRSPAQIYDDHCAAGWRPVRVDPRAIDAAFCKRDTRRVDRGAVSIHGTAYRHSDLPNGRTVTIALPYRREASPLVDLGELGWTDLVPDMLHLPGDIAGAIEGGRIQARNVRETIALRRDAGRLDLAATIDDRVTALPTRAAPAPLIDVLMSNEAQSIADARRAGDQRQLSAPSEAERRRARLDAENRDLEAYFARQRN